MGRLNKFLAVFSIFSLLSVFATVSLYAGGDEYSGKLKSVNTETKEFVVTTDDGKDVTFTSTDKTKVTIIDVDGAKTKADMGSVLSADSEGADKADSVVITADGKMKASKVVATTTRRMTLTKEEIAKRIETLVAGNKAIADEIKVKTDTPGTIKGSVRVMARTSEGAIIFIQEINGNDFTPVAKKLVPAGADNVKTKAAGSTPEYPMMDQVNIAFAPHVLPIVTGSVVDFPNSDTVRHNVFGPDPIPGTDEKINLGTYDIGTVKTVSLAADGELPLLCNVHAEMSGYIVAVPNPYFTITDRKGAFTLDNVPPGTYTLTTWHERFKPVSAEITVEAGQTAEIKLPTMKKKK